MNIPPAEGEAIDERREGWAELSYDIFHLNPELPIGFATRLLNECVLTPAHWMYSISFSESISVLVGNNITSVDFTNCMKVPCECEDSRALYSLGALHWCPSWEQVGSNVFRFLLSKKAPIRNSAYWVLLRIPTAVGH
jgi:hypothetical protein